MNIHNNTFSKLSRLSLALLSLLLLAACSRGAPDAKAAKPPAPKVKIASVQTATVEESSDFIANLQSRRSVTLQPQIEGQITQIFVKSGDIVASGTPIIQVDPAKQQASLSSLNASAQAAQADLQNVKDTLNSLRAQRQSKLADLKYNQEQYKRYATLNAQGAVTQQNVDQFRNSLSAAESSLASLDAQINAQQAAVVKAGKNLQAAQENTKQQQVQLQYFRISAPFAGTVGDFPVKIGDYVNTSTKLVTITQNQSLEVNISVPLERVPDVHLGTQVELMDAQGNSLGTSEVFFISPKVNNDTQSVLIKALFDNSKGQLRAEQYARAKVIWAQHPGFLIPTTAVTRIAGQPFVFIAVSQGQSQLIAQQKPVKLGAIQGNNYQALDGLQPGDKVIVSGVMKLSDGIVISPEE